MNYIFRDAVLDYANGGDARKLAANLEEMREAYPPQSFAASMNLLSTHDTARSLHVFGDVAGQATPEQVALAKQKLRLAVFLQMTYPGAPAIFYGDEVGVTGGPDPLNRGTYPWADRGGHPDNALLADFRRLTRLRHDLPVLRRGKPMAPLHVDEHVLVLARRDANKVAITATNNAGSLQVLTLAVPRGARLVGWTDALTQAPAPVDVATRSLTLVIPARSGVVLVNAASHVPKH
jgi:glycosidase